MEIQRHQLVRQAIQEAVMLQSAIDRGKVQLADTDVSFSVRARPFFEVMRLWRPNPRNVEKEFLLPALDPQKWQTGTEGGSGEGFLTEDLVRRTSWDVLATDPSIKQQRFLLDKTSGWDPPYDHLVIPIPVSPDSPGFLNYCRNTHRAGRLDYATGLAFWHHVPNQKAMIENYAQVLRVGGIVVGADVLKGSRLWRMFTEFLPGYVIGGHTGTYVDRETIKSWCVDTPFEIVEIREEVMEWQPFAGKEDMGAFVGGLHGLNLSFPEVADNVQKYLDFGYNKKTGQDTLYWDKLIRFKLIKVREWTQS